MTEREMEKMDDICAQAGEHFGDYLVIVRTKKKFGFRTSDLCWGIGGARRFLDEMKEQERIKIEDAMRQED